MMSIFLLLGGGESCICKGRGVLVDQIISRAGAGKININFDYFE
jgi:hypothetical protein